MGSFTGEAECWTLFNLNPPVETVSWTLFSEFLEGLGGTVLTLVLPILL